VIEPLGTVAREQHSVNFALPLHLAQDEVSMLNCALCVTHCAHAAQTALAFDVDMETGLLLSFRRALAHRNRIRKKSHHERRTILF
jgi:hypothetical protein